MPKVSVLISIYRPDERFLAEQLETVDDQDFDDFEVVVYNDCPEDRSWEDFCRAHCTRHPLRYEQGTQNLGYKKAFEHLVTIAEGEYLALADQDDRWLPGRISRGVKVLDEGFLLVSCDRQIIDGDGNLGDESWRTNHPRDAASNWNTGDHITPKAAFTCYSLGMATMMRTDTARALIPFPTCCGHDKWLTLGASAMGPIASIDVPLVQYRRHGANKTGTLHAVDCKDDWYRTRTQDSHELVCDFVGRFPDCPDGPAMLAFAEARLHGDVRGIWQHRELAPAVARFEIVLHYMPEWMFKCLLAVMRLRGD